MARSDRTVTQLGTNHTWEAHEVDYMKFFTSGSHVPRVPVHQRTLCVYSSTTADWNVMYLDSEIKSASGIVTITSILCTMDLMYESVVRDLAIPYNTSGHCRQLLCVGGC